ncbi:MAG: hypothetical protein ABTQ29_07245 [Siculibacillus sp.]
MTISLAGLIGALMGAVIGVMDWGIVAGFLRRAWEKRDGGRTDPGTTAQRELIMKVGFLLTVATFAGLGYWFGVAMSGG